MGLKVNIDDIPGTEVDEYTGITTAKKAYGKKAALGYYERTEDYHSDQHAHISEQYNFMLKGKAWWFVEEKAYLLEPGDIHRVPGNAVHWAKTEEGPVEMVECHVPPRIGSEAEFKECVGLFTEDEDPRPDDAARNIQASMEYASREEEMMEEYYQRTRD
jgi:mannose-6-phosphate isomerase-like protein (cupin superfamily)